MVIPAQRLSDLESAAWQNGQRLERIESDLFELKQKADQHGVALAATMQDLRDFRIDVGRKLERHTAILDAIVKHFGIEIPEPADVEAAAV